MRKLIAVLALSTSALAVTSIYLWNQRWEARAQVELLSQASDASAMPSATHSKHGADPTAIASTAAPAATVNSATDDAKARQKAQEDSFRDSARQQLVQLTDATMRAQMLEEWKEGNFLNKAKYARYLGISEADAERLIDVLAEQYLVRSEAFARCTLRPPCDYQPVFRETNAAQQLALTDLLGAEKAQRFEHYMYTGVERNMVSSFLRDKIPAANQISDAQAEQLIDALAEERRLVEATITQRGFEPFVYPMEGVVFTFQNSVYEPGNTDERLKEAADYNRRIHARAKAILTPQQLAGFEQMQEAGIVGVKYWLRQQERDRATRTATSGGNR
jgi:hypothetical protein